ncbi:MAG: head GIN domain-containing protein [Alteraurantiacibacter sp.]
MTDRHGSSSGAGGFDKIFRSVGPFVAMAAMGGMMAAARKSGKFEFDWDKSDCGPGSGFGGGFGMGHGVPLEELDMSGETTTGVVLAGADMLVVTEGDDFTVSVQGDDDAKAALRFRLKDGALHVASRNANDDAEGIATITVTMPAPRKATIAGSGRIQLAKLADEAEVVIAGSGRIDVSDLAVDRLDVSIAGSGKFKASGTVARLDLNVAGSGSAKLGEVSVDKARVTIAGSGDAVFASDGEVKARLMGSGTVTVRGSARCKVQGMGSGSLVCERGEDKAA